MRSILRFSLAIEGECTITMPKGAKVLSVGQNPTGEVSIWAMCSSKYVSEARTFLLVGTGNPLHWEEGDNVVFVGTVVERNRPLVWHVFEKLSPTEHSA